MKLTRLQGKPVVFTPMDPPTTIRRYAVVGVPPAVPTDHFVGTHGVTAAYRVLKRGNPTTCVVLTTTQQMPDKIRVAYGQSLNVRPYVPDAPQCFRCFRWGHTSQRCPQDKRCYHCGTNHPENICPRRPDTPRCLNCGEGHATSYRGCPARIERVQQIRKRMGLPMRTATPPITQAWSLPEPRSTSESDFPALVPNRATSASALPLVAQVTPTRHSAPQGHTQGHTPSPQTRFDDLASAVEDLKGQVTQLTGLVQDLATAQAQIQAPPPPTAGVLTATLAGLLSVLMPKLKASARVPLHKVKASLRRLSIGARATKARPASSP